MRERSRQSGSAPGRRWRYIGPMRDAAELYDSDFYAWTRTQARELRRFAATRPNVPLDLAHLAEEIADLGTEQRAKLRRWTVGIIERLLLLGQASAVHRDAAGDIIDFRLEIAERLSKTLRRDLQRHLPALYADAVRILRQKLPAYGEHDVAARLPETCPYTFDQVLGDWWPEGVMPGRGKP